jgi:hypothetical protein
MNSEEEKILRERLIEILMKKMGYTLPTKQPKSMRESEEL